MSFDKERAMADAGNTTAQSSFIDLPTGHFHYLSWNAQRVDLPGVLLLHGLTSSARTWTRVGSALATQYRVYALDQRGHGKSVKSGPGTYSFQQLAADAAAFLEAVALQHPILIGHSWGGMIALVLATRYGQQEPGPAISHVVLEEPALRFWDHAHEFFLKGVCSKSGETS